VGADVGSTVGSVVGDTVGSIVGSEVGGLKSVGDSVGNSLGGHISHDLEQIDFNSTFPPGIGGYTNFFLHALFRLACLRSDSSAHDFAVSPVTLSS